MPSGSAHAQPEAPPSNEAQEAPAAAAAGGRRRRRQQQPPATEQLPPPEEDDPSASAEPSQQSREPDVRLPSPRQPAPARDEAYAEENEAEEERPRDRRQQRERSQADGARGDARRERRERSDGRMRAPPAGAFGLADEERLLLSAPLRLNKADLYPSSAEPLFPMEAPAPVIGEIDASYIENPVEKTFRRVRPGTEPQPDLPLPEAAAQGEFPDFASSPSGATQGVALLLGLTLHLAQGALAGAALLQFTMAPWPDATNTLIRPLAYAPLALPMQRLMALLAGASFLAAADLHAAAPRATSGVLLVLYALIVVTCVVQLPTNVALHVGRKQRERVLTAALAASVGNESQVPYRPDELPEAQLESGGGFFSTALSSTQFGLFEAIVGLRALLATFAWLLASLLQSFPAFGVPPLTNEEYA